MPTHPHFLPIEQKVAPLSRERGKEAFLPFRLYEAYAF